MLAFREVDDYTTFKAEFAMDAGDIVFHFFKTDEVKSLDPSAQNLYWQTTFAAALESVTPGFFGVTSDSGRLQAKHVYDDEQPYSAAEPLDSWWLRAFGFGHRLDPHKLALKFLETLDSALDAGPGLPAASPLPGSATKRT
jgi:hypothetical protein